MTSKVTPGPDQRIGWIVAWACFFINFITAGLARSSGVLYVALIDAYGITREEATAPFSLRISVRSMTGPLVGLLGQRYGYRDMTAVGGFVAGLGSILCAFTPSVSWITFFWGIIHGIGFGLSTILHMMVVGQYFDKYKAVALGFSYSGDCFGTFAFPVIIEHLLLTYSVNGMFLIMGGIVMNVIPLALLLKKPPWKRNEGIQKNISSILIKESPTQNSSHQFHEKGETNKSFIASDEFLNEIHEPNAAKFMSKNVISHPLRANSSVNFHTDYELAKVRNRASSMIEKKNSAVTENGVSKNLTKENFDKKIRNNLCTVISNLPIEEQHINTCDVFSHEKNSISSETFTESNLEIQSNVPLEGCKEKRSTSFIDQITHDLAEKIRSASFASQVAQEGFITLVDCDQEQEGNGDMTCNSSLNHFDNTFKSDDGNKPHSQVPDIALDTEKRPMKEKSLFKTLIHTNSRPLFFLISFTMAAFAYLLVGVLTVIIDYATDQKYSMDMSKFLLIAYSVTDLIGRLTLGIIIDKKLVEMKTYSFLVLVISGLSVAVLPLNHSFYYMVLCVSIFGFFQGGTAIMFPILITTYMEKNEESIAMGCLNFYSGLLMLGMGRMIGFFRDNIGAYDGVFYILGIVGFVIGSLWLAEPVLLRFEKRHLKREGHHDSISTNL